MPTPAHTGKITISAFARCNKTSRSIQTTWPIQHKGGRTAGALIKHAASLEANRATFTARVLATEPPAALTPTYAAYMQHVHTQATSNTTCRC
jgi:hypothetical protein